MQTITQPIAVFFPSLFVTLSFLCKYPIRFAIKGATSLSCQGKLQVAGECYTAVEFGQNSVCVISQYQRTHMHIAIQRVTLLHLCEQFFSSDGQKNDRRIRMAMRLSISGEDFQVKLRSVQLESKLTAFQSSFLRRSYHRSSDLRTNYPRRFSPLPPLPRSIFSGNLANLQGV